MIATRLRGRRRRSAPRRIQPMLAAIVASPGRLRLEMVPQPAPGPGQVRVRVGGCVVSPGDAAVWRGQHHHPYPLRPGEPGAEVWGSIDALGAGVRGLYPGEPVAMVTQRGFAEYAVGAAEHTVPLPPETQLRGPHVADVPDHDARPVGRLLAGLALGRAMNVWRRMGTPEPGERVAVVGMGMTGLALTQLAVATGASVTAISRRETGLRRARSVGAEATIAFCGVGDATEQAEQVTGGAGFDRVIEATGAGGPTLVAGDIVRPGGRLILIGGSTAAAAMQRDGRTDLWRRTDVQLMSGRTRDVATAVRGLREAMDAITEGRLHLGHLRGRRFELPQLGKAMRYGGGVQRCSLRTWVSL